MKTGLSYKKADKLIFGAVKNLTSILPQKKEDYHEEQYYAVFWVSHINKMHVSMPLTPGTNGPKESDNCFLLR